MLRVAVELLGANASHRSVPLFTPIYQRGHSRSRHVGWSIEEGKGIEPSGVTLARGSNPLCHLGATFQVPAVSEGAGDPSWTTPSRYLTEMVCSWVHRDSNPGFLGKSQVLCLLSYRPVVRDRGIEPLSFCL